MEPNESDRRAANEALREKLPQSAIEAMSDAELGRFYRDMHAAFAAHREQAEREEREACAVNAETFAEMIDINEDKRATRALRMVAAQIRDRGKP